MAPSYSTFLGIRCCTARCDAYNLALALARAATALRYLIEKGAPEQRLVAWCFSSAPPGAQQRDSWGQ